MGIAPCTSGGYVSRSTFGSAPTAPMDCKRFRKHHLAYLDDTLPGTQMAAAQRHVLACDACAAHDTLVRRSLMVVQSLPTLEPSAAFQAKLRARLEACRQGDEPVPTGRWRDRADGTPRPVRTPRLWAAAAASAVIGVLAYQAWQASHPRMLSIQPVMAMGPVPVSPAPYLTPRLVRAMSTGNPVWPAALMVEDAPMQAMADGFVLTQATMR